MTDEAGTGRRGKVSLQVFVALARAEATARPLVSWSWEVLRATGVFASWTLGAFLLSWLANGLLFLLAVPELAALARGPQGVGQAGGGLFSILLGLVYLASFLLSNPLVTGVSLLFLLVFPLAWGWLGFRHARAQVFAHWMGAVRHPVRQWLERVRRAAPGEALRLVSGSADATVQVLANLLAWRERRAWPLRALSQGPALFARELSGLLERLSDLADPDGVEAAMESLQRRATFPSRRGTLILLALDLGTWLALKLLV